MVAGVAKFADPAGTRTAVGEFGAPASLVRSLAVVIPLAELVVAVLLVYGPTRTIGGVGALGLLALFSGAIAVRLARGQAPDCHCFGQLHSAPVSWKTLVRNGVLATLAGVAWIAGLAGDTPSAVAWMQDVNTLGVLLTLFVGAIALAILAGGGWFMAHLLRQHGRMLLRLDTLEEALAARGIIPYPHEAGSADGLAPGVPAPAFALGDLLGGTITLHDLLAPGLPLILVFSHPGCTPCVAMLPEIGKWQSVHRADFTIAVISHGSADDNRATAVEHDIERVLLQREREIAEAYLAYATPSAVLVSREGIIASPVVQGAPAIRVMISSAALGAASHVNGRSSSDNRNSSPNDVPLHWRDGIAASVPAMGGHAN